MRTDKAVFYLSIGSKDMRQVRRWIAKLNENLSGMRFENPDWQFEIPEGMNHNNSNLVALFHGLTEFYIKFIVVRLIYQGYWIRDCFCRDAQRHVSTNL